MRNTQKKYMEQIMEEQTKIQQQYDEILDKLEENSSRIGEIIARFEEFIKVMEIEQKYRDNKEQQEINKPWYLRIFCK